MARIGIVGQVYRQWHNNLRHGLNRRYGTPHGLRVVGTDLFCKNLCIATMPYGNVIVINSQLYMTMPESRAQHLIGLLTRMHMQPKYVISNARTPEALNADACAKFGVETLSPWS